MTLSDLSMLTLAAAVALFVTSIFARRTGNKNSKLHLLRKVLAGLVLVLAATYFYERFTG